ncbi:MAG: hypothetical protein GEU88_08240 [Solirubrobacterales bacterium]|nr:hypothetical protein [Solirubrobacterales bacterium]
MSSLRPTPTPALVVPDEQTWTMADRDPADLGADVTYSIARARRVLVADDLPPQLAEPLAQLRAVADPGNGGHVHDTHGEDTPEHAAHGHGDGDDAHHHDADGQDQSAHEHGEGHDMMAIVGEPSADGLVMEPIELRYGPLATPLPGGLAADVTLDGDVVAEARVEALLRAEPSADGRPASPDALAAAAWGEAMRRADAAPAAAGAPAAARWVRVAGIELERAINHLAWLRAFMRLLGWAEVVASVTAALIPLRVARRSLPGGPDRHTPGAVEAASDLEAAGEAIGALARRLDGSRALRLRTGGLGAVRAADAAERNLAGPIARACGVTDDARADDPLYRLLGFEPVVRQEGDALARALLRVDEAEQSAQLAHAALNRVANGDATAAQLRSPTATVEGPRGPLRARRRADGWDLDARGADAARSLAGELMVGEEWAAALVALASLDLSPWVVGR